MAENDFTLTEEQQQIIDINEGIHLVLAPPGSGKTELLALRVEKAIQSGYKDDEMICLTFTNRAAKGMRQRIERKYPANKILIGNIHNFCSRFLVQNHLLPENYSILDEEDADALIREIKSEYGYYDNVSNSELLKYATLLKQESLGFPEKMLLQPDLENVENWGSAKSVCEEYTKRKDIYGFLDFDDLLTKTYAALSSESGYSMSCYKWLQVDEVQDLNPMQWAIIEKIRDTNAVSVYFGDYEQAIFSFMGAQLESLHKIEAICKSNAKNGIHNLQKNFRSPSYLLDIYTDYVKAHFKPVWKKEPEASKIENAEEGSLGLYGVNGTLENEARFIVDKLIPNLLGQKAIIVRYNQTADIISSYLQEKNIPHFRISGYDLFRKESVKGLMAFLSVLDNPFDKMSWIRMYYNSGTTATLKEARRFIHEMLQLRITPLYLFDNNNLPPLAEKQREHIVKENVKNINDKFVGKFGDLFSDILSKMNSQITLNELIDIYFNYLLDNGLLDKTDYEETEKPEINKLRNHIKHFTEPDKQLTLVGKIKKYVPEYRQMKESDLFFGEDDILLTTVHKAKGLEFENVIVAEATDSTYPNWRQDNIEEDARALYVAMTRAKKRLYITYHNSFVSQYGKWYPREMSRFLEAVEKQFVRELPESETQKLLKLKYKYEKFIKEIFLNNSKFFLRVIHRYYPLTEHLIEKFKDDWSFKALSQNENIKWSTELIEKYKQKWGKYYAEIYKGYAPIEVEGMVDRWDWTSLSRNRSLPWSKELIDKYENKWDFQSWKIEVGDYVTEKIFNHPHFFGLPGNEKIPWTIELIEKYYDKISWTGLSKNIGLSWTFELIMKFINKWNWRVLSENKSLPWSIEFIRAFIDRWDWTVLSRNSHIQWNTDIIDAFIDKLDWVSLSKNESLPWSNEFFSKYIDRWGWNEFYVCERWGREKPDHFLKPINKINWNVVFIEKNFEKLNWSILSSNKSIPWTDELIEKVKDNLDWLSLSSNESVSWTEELIEKMKDKWDWINLSGNRSLPWSRYLIKKYIDKWNWMYNLEEMLRNVGGRSVIITTGGVGLLSSNNALPWSLEFIKEFEDKWDWNCLSSNTGIPWTKELIEEYIDNWNWYFLSSNHKLPWSMPFIEEYNNKWNWEQLSTNNGIPWSVDLIEKYEDKWNWNSISEIEDIPLSDELINRHKDELNWRSRKYVTYPDYDDYGNRIFIEKGFLTNKNLPWSIDFLEKYKDKWEWQKEADNGYQLCHTVDDSGGIIFAFMKILSEWQEFQYREHNIKPDFFQVIQTFNHLYKTEGDDWDITIFKYICDNIFREHLTESLLEEIMEEITKNNIQTQ